MSILDLFEPMLLYVIGFVLATGKPLPAGVFLMLLGFLKTIKVIVLKTNKLERNEQIGQARFVGEERSIDGAIKASRKRGGSSTRSDKGY